MDTEPKEAEMKLNPTLARKMAHHVRRFRNALDVPLSSLELSSRGIFPNESTTWIERRFIREILPGLMESEGIVLYDIGAHRGAYASAMLKVPNISTVVSFEPNPESASVLRSTLGENGRYLLYQCALGTRNELATLNLSKSVASSSLLEMRNEHTEIFPNTDIVSQVDVQVRRLDDLIKEENIPRPDIVKIDVQGFEDRVLEGGRETLSTARWMLIEVSFSELYDDMPLAEEMLAKTSSLGWKVSGFSEPLLDRSGKWVSANALLRKD